MQAAPVAAQNPTPAGGDEDWEGPWHRLIGILQYLEDDYPLAIESQSEFELAEQRAFIVEALVAAREIGPKLDEVIGQLEDLKVRIDRQDDPGEVSETCARLIEEIAEIGGVIRSPRRTPDLEVGRQLYGQLCASCHAADGSADVPLAAEMEPPPANFLDDEVMGGLSPYKGFNTVSFGIPGTGMPGFPTLSEDERWSVSFFLHTLRHESCGGVRVPRAPVRELAALSDDALSELYGEEALACLRMKMPQIDPAQSLLIARSGLQEVLRLAEAGEPLAARGKLIDAYLIGVEPVELLIQTHDRSLVQQIEAAFLGIRYDLERGRLDIEEQVRKLLILLDRAEDATHPASLSVAFWGAFLVILREGFEAMIVIAALLAVLKRLGQTHHARLVHLGWVTALILGAVGFVYGQRLLTHFNPEWVEGIAALLAVAMLLYHIVWLSARSQIADYMKEIRSKMEGALGRGSAFGLFAIAFTAVLRESLEVVLFLQGLSVDSPQGVAWGAGVGLLVLFALVLFVAKVGFKLPMKALFQVSTVLLFATAVVLLGKGIHALQIVGAIPVRPLPIFTFDWLGIFPDAFSLGAQGLLALSPLVWTRIKRQKSKRPTAPAAVS